MFYPLEGGCYLEGGSSKREKEGGEGEDVK